MGQSESNPDFEDAIVALLFPLHPPGTPSPLAAVRRFDKCKRCLLLRTFEHRIQQLSATCDACQEIRFDSEHAMENACLEINGGVCIKELKLCEKHMHRIEQCPDITNYGAEQSPLSEIYSSSEIKCDLCKFQVPYGKLALISVLAFVVQRLLWEGAEAQLTVACLLKRVKELEVATAAKDKLIRSSQTPAPAAPAAPACSFLTPSYPQFLPNEAYYKGPHPSSSERTP